MKQGKFFFLLLVGAILAVMAFALVIEFFKPIQKAPVLRLQSYSREVSK